MLAGLLLFITLDKQETGHVFDILFGFARGPRDFVANFRTLLENWLKKVDFLSNVYERDIEEALPQHLYKFIDN